MLGVTSLDMSADSHGQRAALLTKQQGSQYIHENIQAVLPFALAKEVGKHGSVRHHWVQRPATKKMQTDAALPPGQRDPKTGREVAARPSLTVGSRPGGILTARKRRCRWVVPARVGVRIKASEVVCAMG